MKAIIREKYGPPDVLEVRELARPVPNEGEVLVKLRAVSLNASDWELLRGKPLYSRMFGLFTPKIKILGSDIAGRVEAVGKNVTEFQPGDAVFGDLMILFGGFAEYCCAPASMLTLKPDAVSFEDVSCIPQAGCIALQGIRDKGGVKPGDKVLINGAGGGSGMFAIQLAKMFGAEVTGVDNAAKQDFMQSLGADHVIDYRKEDFTKNGQSYDLILDLAAYRSIFDYQCASKPGGTYFMVGGSLALMFQLLLLGPLIAKFTDKHLSILGVKFNKDLDFILGLIQSGNLAIKIDRTFPLSEVPDALRYHGEGKAKGKVVISIDQDD